MASMWRKTGDNLKNGAILGALMGIGIIFGEKIIGWLNKTIPENWLYFGNLSIQIYLIVLLAIIGYMVDRK